MGETRSEESESEDSENEESESEEGDESEFEPLAKRPCSTRSGRHMHQASYSSSVLVSFAAVIRVVTRHAIA